MTGYEPDAGHLIWTDFEPRVGREQGGRRPALVVSPIDFFQSTGFVIVCPVTSRVRPFASSVVLPADLAIKGEVLTSQVRSIDTQGRPVIASGVIVPKDVLDDVRSKLAALLGLD